MKIADSYIWIKLQAVRDEPALARKERSRSAFWIRPHPVLGHCFGSWRKSPGVLWGVDTRMALALRAKRLSSNGSNDWLMTVLGGARLTGESRSAGGKVKGNTLWTVWLRLNFLWSTQPSFPSQARGATHHLPEQLLPRFSEVHFTDSSCCGSCKQSVPPEATSDSCNKICSTIC